jgi:hypothetical protein
LKNLFSHFSRTNQFLRFHGAQQGILDEFSPEESSNLPSFYRSSFLGVLCKESNSLSLYDIQNTNGATAEEMEPTTLERGVTLTDGTETISSFAWHLAEENRMLYTTSLLNIKVRGQIVYLQLLNVLSYDRTTWSSIGSPSIGHHLANWFGTLVNVFSNT